MIAHVLDENGKILNTILVEDLDFMPNLVDAELIGGTIGDSVIDGVLVPYVEPTPEPVVPKEVTMRQARLALLKIGKLSAVDAAIDSLPSPLKEEARIEWDYSSTVVRSRPIVAMIGQGLDLTNEELDALFIEAATL